MRTRADLVTRLTHLTRGDSEKTAFERLWRILLDKKLKASNEKGINAAGAMVCCFQEIPLYSIAENLQFEKVSGKKSSAISKIRAYSAEKSASFTLLATATSATLLSSLSSRSNGSLTSNRSQRKLSRLSRQIRSNSTQLTRSASSLTTSRTSKTGTFHARFHGEFQSQPSRMSTTQLIGFLISASTSKKSRKTAKLTAATKTPSTLGLAPVSGQ